MTTNTLDKQFCTAYKRLKTDQNGRLLLKDALEKAGIENTLANRYRLKRMTGWKEVRVKKEYEIGNLGMQVGQKTMMHDWDYMQTPSVYAIINKKTKRMYIGSSKRPDLRRAVHYYWLKNYWKFGCSNVFFGSLSLKKDVEKYGVDSFYLEILKSMPDANREELEFAEQEIIEKYLPKQLYNKTAHGDIHAKVHVGFYEIEPEFKKLADEYEKLSNQLASAELRHIKFKHNRVKNNREIVEQRRSGKITTEVAKQLTKKNSDETKVRIEQLNNLRKQTLELGQFINAETKKLIKKYKAATKPLY